MLYQLSYRRLAPRAGLEPATTALQVLKNFAVRFLLKKQILRALPVELSGYVVGFAG